MTEHGTDVEITYEVWREHRKGGPDVCVGRRMSRSGALRLLDEIGDDLANFCTFYMVRCTTTRERVTSPASSAPSSQSGCDSRGLSGQHKGE